MEALSCTPQVGETVEPEGQFDYFVEQFDDMRVLRYRLPAFDALTTKQKKLIYYLSEAALCGRDILWDQNFRHNLLIRKTLEAVLTGFGCDKETDEFKAFITYTKRVFFANGIHHHNSSDKLKPGFSEKFFIAMVKNCDPSLLPVAKGKTADDILEIIVPAMFSPDIFSKKVERGEGKELIAGSASGFYDGVTQKEVEAFYSAPAGPKEPRPVSKGLNSRVVKRNGKITEEVYRSGGLYGEAIDKIVHWLSLASASAENEIQQKEFELLMEYYKTGNLKTWDDYNVLWAENTEPEIDYINGFIEVYEDPLGMKATWEAIVNYKDPEATKRTGIITANAQWFEANSPIMEQFKKENVTGVAAKVINIAMLGGDCYPVSPLGINLPNSDWIRKEVGSKSVTLANIADAFDIVSAGSGVLDEFAATKEEIERVKKYGSLTGALHTDLHECIGHASGKLAEGTDPNALRNYQSPLEEARADLVALYYMPDKKIIDLGLLPDPQAAMAEYDSYIRSGMLTQLVRIRPGKQIEQAHMRAGALISGWAYEKGKEENVIELFAREGKTFVRINDYDKLRVLFGNLLREIQRIKSEGDFEAGRTLVEKYGVKVDPVVHAEILERYARLNLAPYSGFINPKLEPVFNDMGEITDVKVDYSEEYLPQMLRYGMEYSFLRAELW